MITVIVEAPDCAGKTTLIANLRSRIHASLGEFAMFSLEHCTYPPKDLTKEQQIAHQRKEYEDYVDSISMSTNVVWLFDRFMTGELIYGPKYRGYTPDYIHELEKKLSRDQTYFITLVADPEVIKSRFDGEFIKEEDISHLVDEYRKQFYDCEIRHKTLIDVSNMNPDQVCKRVYDFIKLGVAKHKISLAIDHIKRATDLVEGIVPRVHNFDVPQLAAHYDDLRMLEAVTLCNESQDRVQDTTCTQDFKLISGYYVDVSANKLLQSTEVDSQIWVAKGFNQEYRFLTATDIFGARTITIHGSNLQHVRFC